MESASFQRAIGVGKERADAAGAGGAEDGIGEGMGHDVGVGVPGEALRMRDGDAAEHEAAARREAMGVVADSRACHAATVCCDSISE